VTTIWCWAFSGWAASVPYSRISRDTLLRSLATASAWCGAALMQRQGRHWRCCKQVTTTSWMPSWRSLRPCSTSLRVCRRNVTFVIASVSRPGSASSPFPPTATLTRRKMNSSAGVMRCYVRASSGTVRRRSPRQPYWSARRTAHGVSAWTTELSTPRPSKTSSDGRKIVG
jgi:hypothetical protein